MLPGGSGQEKTSFAAQLRPGCQSTVLGTTGPSRVPTGGTLCPEGLATEVALEGLLAGVRAQVHVEVGFLREGVVAELANIGPLVPAGRGNVTFIAAFASFSPSG